MNVYKSMTRSTPLEIGIQASPHLKSQQVKFRFTTSQRPHGRVRRSVCLLPRKLEISEWHPLDRRSTSQEVYKIQTQMMQQIACSNTIRSRAYGLNSPTCLRSALPSHSLNITVSSMHLEVFKDRIRGVRNPYSTRARSTIHQPIHGHNCPTCPSIDSAWRHQFTMMRSSSSEVTARAVPSRILGAMYQPPMNGEKWMTSQSVFLISPLSMRMA